MPVTINGTTGIAGADGSAGTPAVQGTDTNTGMFFPAADTIAFAEGGTECARFTSTGGFVVGTTTDPGAGKVADNIGNVRSVPANSQTGAYVLLATDAGKFITNTTGGVTVPQNILSQGDSVTIYNDSGSSQTITQGSGVTMYLVGTATTGNRTLAQRGLCTVFCVASNTFVITGGGLT